MQGHAYTITGLYRVSLDREAGARHRVSLVRVRNPWGDKNEWRGQWSDGDKSWDLVSTAVKREMGLHYMHDGEFWIEFFTDFCKEFEAWTSYCLSQHSIKIFLLSGGQHLHFGT